MAYILVSRSLVVFYMLTILHFWPVVVLVFSSSSTSVLSIVWCGTLDLTHRKVNLPVLVVTVLMLTVLLLEQSLYVGRHRLNLGCNFRCKECDIDPSCFIGIFYSTFNNILNVMGSKRPEITALHSVQTYCLPSVTYSLKSLKSHIT